jgi:STE24 endopeptidase
MRLPFAAVAAGFCLGYCAVRCAETVATYRAPAPSLPQDAARYGRTRRALMLGGIARSVAGLATSAFLLAPRLERRDRPIRWGDAWCAFSIVSTIDAVLDLPVDYVEHYRLERAYGMSEQSIDAWLIDRAKILGLACAIGGPLVALLSAVVRRMPKRWLWIVGLALGPFQVLVQLVVPTFIAPMFNTFKPVEGPLEERLRALARRYGVGDAAILRVDMSRRTKKANAYVIGLFDTHRIVVGDTLLESFDGDEIEFVVAHELGHYVHRDTWKLVAIGTAAGIALLAMADRAIEPQVPRGGITWMTRMLYHTTALSTLAGPLLAALARQIEWDADAFALEATRQPRWGVAAFARLREKNLAEDEQPPWMEVLFSTHPSLKSRIAALERAPAG